MNENTTAPNPPFNDPQQKHIEATVDKTLTTAVAYWRRIILIVAAIVTPVLGFLGYVGTDQLRKNWDEQQNKIIKDSIAEQAADITKGLKGQLSRFVENQKQAHALHTREFERDRERLRDELVMTIREAAQKTADGRLQLENFLNQQTASIGAMKTAIEGEVAKAVTTRENLDRAKDDAARSERDLRLQLEKAAAASVTIASQLAQLNVQCTELREKSDELDKQIASVRPKMDALRMILADQNVAEIFSKLRQDFSRIRSLEARITYVFPAGFQDPFLGFDGLWLRKENDTHFLQFRPERDITTIDRGNAMELVCRYVLFAPHQMSIEGQPLEKLKDIERLEIYVKSDPKMYPGQTDEQRAAVYADYIKRFQESLKQITAVRMQILINGYSSFDKTVEVGRLNMPSLPENSFAEKWERMIVLPVAELFAEPEAHYSRQFTPAILKPAGTAGSSGSMQ